MHAPWGCSACWPPSLAQGSTNGGGGRGRGAVAGPAPGPGDSPLLHALAYLHLASPSPVHHPPQERFAAEALRQKVEAQRTAAEAGSQAAEQVAALQAQLDEARQEAAQRGAEVGSLRKALGLADETVARLKGQLTALLAAGEMSLAEEEAMERALKGASKVSCHAMPCVLQCERMCVRGCVCRCSGLQGTVKDWSEVFWIIKIEVHQMPRSAPYYCTAQEKEELGSRVEALANEVASLKGSLSLAEERARTAEAAAAEAAAMKESASAAVQRLSTENAALAEKLNVQVGDRGSLVTEWPDSWMCRWGSCFF